MFLLLLLFLFLHFELMEYLRNLCITHLILLLQQFLDFLFLFYFFVIGYSLLKKSTSFLLDICSLLPHRVHIELFHLLYTALVLTGVRLPDFSTLEFPFVLVLLFWFLLSWDWFRFFLVVAVGLLLGFLGMLLLILRFYL